MCIGFTYVHFTIAGLKNVVHYTGVFVMSSLNQWACLQQALMGASYSEIRSSIPTYSMAKFEVDYCNVDFIICFNK